MITTKQAVEILAQNPPPAAAGRAIEKVGDLNAKIYALETRLGIPHKPPMFNNTSLRARVLQLESAITGKGIAPTEQIPPVVAKAAPVAPVEGQLTAAADWMKLSDTDRVSFCRGSGELVTTEFAKLSPAHRMDFMRQGGKVIDGPAPTAAVDHGGATVITRQHFEGMTPAIRMAYIQNGGKISE